MTAAPTTIERVWIVYLVAVGCVAALADGGGAALHGQIGRAHV